MYTLLSEDHLDNAFSITFHDYDLQNGTMYDAEILEVSLVWRGSNKDARLMAVSKQVETLKEEVDETVVEEKETKTEVESTTTTPVIEEDYTDFQGK